MGASPSGGKESGTAEHTYTHEAARSEKGTNLHYTTSKHGVLGKVR